MTKQTRDILITGASLLGGEPTDIALSGGTIVAIGADARDAVRDPRVIDADGLDRPARPGRHPHPPAPARRRGRRDRLYRHARCRRRRLHRRATRWPTRRPRRTAPAIVDQVLRLGEEADWVEVRPVGAVTEGLEGKHLASTSAAMARSRSKVRVFSDDGKCVSDPVLMRRALEYVKGFGGVIAQHSQDPAPHRGRADERVGAVRRAGPAPAGPPSLKRRSSPATSCSPSTWARACTCATCPPRAPSTSCAGARPSGVDITAEATPHHLLLTERAGRAPTIRSTR